MGSGVNNGTRGRCHGLVGGAGGVTVGGVVTADGTGAVGLNEGAVAENVGLNTGASARRDRCGLDTGDGCGGEDTGTSEAAAAAGGSDSGSALMTTTGATRGFGDVVMATPVGFKAGERLVEMATTTGVAWLEVAPEDAAGVGGESDELLLMLLLLDPDCWGGS